MGGELPYDEGSVMIEVRKCLSWYDELRKV